MLNFSYLQNALLKRSLFGFVFLFSAQAALANSLILTEQQLQNLGVKLTQAQLASQTQSLHYPAEVVIPNAAQQVVNTAQTGVVTKLKYAEGDVVEKGALLAEINSPDLLQLQKDYLQALSELQHLEHRMEKDQQLYEEGIIAERRFHEAKINFSQQQTTVESYRKTLLLSGVSAKDIQRLRQNRTLDSKLSIYAPSNGVVMKQYVLPGQRLSAAEPLYQIADLSQLWLEIHVPIKVAASINKQDKVTICDKQIDAVVTTIGRQVHQVDQGVLVRAEVNVNTDALIPGEFVEVCFVSAVEEDLYLLPRSALFRHGGEYYVFSAHNNEIKALPVKLVSDAAKELIVRMSLAEDNRIVHQGVAALKAAWLAESEE